MRTGSCGHGWRNAAGGGSGLNVFGEDAQAESATLKNRSIERFLMGRPVLNLVGQRFGRLAVMELLGVQRQGAVWWCQCDCGSKSKAASQDLRKGTTKSCGCLRSEIMTERQTTHGQTDSPTYNSWRGMRERCGNPKHKSYPAYGGAGVTVCARWRSSFETFVADMGLSPGAGYSVDRKESALGYTPENCRWATAKQQAANRRAPKRHPQGLSARRHQSTSVEEPGEKQSG